MDTEQEGVTSADLPQHICHVHTDNNSPPRILTGGGGGGGSPYHFYTKEGILSFISTEVMEGSVHFQHYTRIIIHQTIPMMNLRMEMGTLHLKKKYKIQRGTPQETMVQGWTEIFSFAGMMMIDFTCSTVICAVPWTLDVSYQMVAELPHRTV